MKKIILLLMLACFLCSCKSEEIKINVKHFEIKIPGTRGPWLTFKDKYFCYFKLENNESYSGLNLQFYIINEDGTIDAQVPVPEKLQTFYFDLYLKNDTIFTTEYYDHNTFFLDLKNKKWVETKKGVDLYFEDDQYVVYSIDLGEWGGVTWFKNKETGKQYELAATTPSVNKLDGNYYLTLPIAIAKISNPEDLEVSKEPYNYEKIVLEKKGNYYREGSQSLKGAETLFKYEDNDYWNPTFFFTTSFIANDQLYHVYRDSMDLKIGVLKDNELMPIYTFDSDIQPYHWHYDTRNRIQNNSFQSFQFRTDNENVYGIIEINKDRFNVSYFKNTYQEAIMGEEEMNEWVKKMIKVYSSDYLSLTVHQIDSLEEKESALLIDPDHKMGHYLLEDYEVEKPRIFRKVESDELRLITLYYYSKKTQEIELIKFDWGENQKRNINIRNISAWMSYSTDIEEKYKKKFLWLSNHLRTKFGVASSEKETPKGRIKKWEKEDFNIELEYDQFGVELLMYKN